MVTELLLPTLEDVRAYLRLSGWLEQAPGPMGAMWAKNGFRVGVPAEADDGLIRGVVERVAKAEGRPIKQVADAARYVGYDVTYLSAANDSRVADAIPLETAQRMITHLRTMLRATATTARLERAQIGGNYSTVGDRVLDNALMGHTERGSFVIPVMVPLPALPLREDDQPALGADLVGYLEAPPEPFERRVVRTFAQSMQAMHDLVVEPARPPAADELLELVYRGVSQEFCSALAGVLKEDAVAQFEARVDWAARVPAPATMPGRVLINADAVDLVSYVADRLRRQKVDLRQVFSGMIFRLERQPDDPFGEVGISTVRHGHPSKVTVRLTLEQYQRAWDWHNAGQAVLVEGTVRRGPGRRPRVDEPRRFHPLDELHLSDEEN